MQRRAYRKQTLIATIIWGGYKVLSSLISLIFRLKENFERGVYDAPPRLPLPLGVIIAIMLVDVALAFIVNHFAKKAKLKPVVIGSWIYIACLTLFSVMFAVIGSIVS